MSDFAGKIKTKLNDKFPEAEGWTIQQGRPEICPSYTLISIRHKDWPCNSQDPDKNLMIAMNIDGHHSDAGCGVRWYANNNNAEKRNNIYNHMIQTLTEFPTGSRAPWWAYYYNRVHFRNWRKIESLISIRQVIKEEGLAEIFDSFYNDLVKITETLDSYLKKPTGIIHNR